MFFFRSIKKGVAILCLSLFLCGGIVSMSISTSSAAIPVFVVNKQYELKYLIEKILKNIWMDTFVLNLADLEALLNIGDMLSQLQDVLKSFDFQDLIGELTGFLSKDLLESIQSILGGFDIGGLGDIGGMIVDALKTGNIEGVLNDAKGEISKILDEEGRKVFAKTITERMKGAVESAIDKGVGSLEPGTGGGDGPGAPDNPNLSPEQISGAGAKAKEVTKNYMENVKNYNPLILPVNQEGVVEVTTAATITKTVPERNLALHAVAQEQKLLALEGLASIAAKYTDEEKTYRAAVNTSLEQYQDALDAARQVSAKSSPGEALHAIAGLLATQVEQLNTQNVLMVTTTDILADEILMLDRLGNMMIEKYSESLYRNMTERTDSIDSLKQTFKD